MAENPQAPASFEVSMSEDHSDSNSSFKPLFNPKYYRIAEILFLGVFSIILFCETVQLAFLTFFKYSQDSSGTNFYHFVVPLAINFLSLLACYMARPQTNDNLDPQDIKAGILIWTFRLFERFIWGHHRLHAGAAARILLQSCLIINLIIKLVASVQRKKIQLQTSEPSPVTENL